MKSFALALLVIIAGASALPKFDAVRVIESADDVNSREARLVTGAIEAVIQAAAQRIRDAGLDPVLVDRAELNVSILPLILEVTEFVDSLQFVGLSNIAVNNLNYSVLLNRLRFDISLPEIRLSVGDSALSLVILGSGSNRDTSFKGIASVRQIRIAGEVRVNVGIISGISIRDLQLNFSVGGLQSDVSLSVLGLDLSRLVNTVVNETIPSLLETYRNDINDLLERIVWAVINGVL